MKRFLIALCLLPLLLVSCKQAEPPVVESGSDYEIFTDGNLYITLNDIRTTLEINALSDNQIIRDEDRLLLLTGPTDRYQHGILGDVIEARSVTIVELSKTPSIVSKFSVPDDWVIESILPIWSDWDGDGKKEILLTLSNDEEGAKLALYDEAGTLLAESDSIGQGYRWRHALTIESFGGQKLLVDVVTPHIGGTVNFYSWDKEKQLLKTEASLPGYSTHDIGSRDMFMYAYHRDQELLIVPTQSKTELAGLYLEDGQVKEKWRLPLEAKLSGNIDLFKEGDVYKIKAVVNQTDQVILTIPD